MKKSRIVASWLVVIFYLKVVECSTGKLIFKSRMMFSMLLQTVSLKGGGWELPQGPGLKGTRTVSVSGYMMYIGLLGG